MQLRVEHATITSLRYSIPIKDAAGADLRLSTVFTLLEGAKERLQIAEYSLGQTTLEQVRAHAQAGLS